MSRFIKTLIYFLALHACNSTYFIRNDLINLICHKVLELDPFQISVFTSEETSLKNLTQFNLIIKKISYEVPTLIINIDEAKGSIKSKMALNSDLFIMFEHLSSSSTRNIKNNLDFIAEFKPLKPRQKCLVLLTADSSSVSISFERLFIEAWDLKFLDFSVLIIHGHNATIQTYNPFFKSHHQKDISTGQLFPDKLKNMNGYGVKTILFNRAPLMEFVNESSNELTLNGFYYGFWNLTTAALNFTLDYVEIHSTDVAISYLFQKLESGEIDTSIVPHLLGVQITSYYLKGAFLFGSIAKEAEMVLVVPIRYRNSDEFQYKIHLAIITHASMTALIVLITMVVIKFFKLNLTIWSPFYIFALLFGITVNKKPLKFFEKLIYIVLTVMSIQYSSSTFAIFSDYNVMKNEEIEYDALEEFKNPSFPIYMDHTFFSKQNTEAPQRVKNHVYTKLDKHCYEKLAEQGNNFCFNSAGYAQYMIRKNLGKRTSLKIARPMIMGDYVVHAHAKNSPFLSRFERKFQQIFESDLRDNVSGLKKFFENEKKSNDQDVKFEPTKSMSYQLILFAIGCFCGAVTFAFEIIINKF